MTIAERIEIEADCTPFGFVENLDGSQSLCRAEPDGTLIELRRFKPGATDQVRLTALRKAKRERIDSRAVVAP